MIYAMTSEVAPLMQALLPCEVFFGRERFGPAIARGPRVRVTYDENADNFEVTPGTMKNTSGPTTGTTGQPLPTQGRTAMVKWVGIAIDFWASSTKSAAGEHDHKRAVDALVDAFMIQWQVVLHNRRNLSRNIVGGFVIPKDIEDSPREIGAHYLATMQVARSVQTTQGALAASGLIAVPYVIVRALTPETLSPKVTMSGAPNITVSAVGNTYTRSSGSFLADGFLKDMPINVSGCTTAANNGVKTIAGLNASTLTVNEACTTDAAVAGVQITS